MDFSQFLCMPAELSLLLAVLILFVADLFMCADNKGKGVYNTPLPLVVLLLPICVNVWTLISGAGASAAFGGMYVTNGMAVIVKTILSVGTFITFLMAHRWMSREENLVKQGEFYIVTLFTLLGMYLMISAGHFLMFFIGLELASVPMAALVAYDKLRYESAEAGAKFILLALFSAALMLYGISLLYGTFGTLYFHLMSLGSGSSLTLTLLGLAFFLAGMGFKISLVPFHLWTADTYEGAPTVVTGFLSVISKGSAAFVLFTVLVQIFSMNGELFAAWNHALMWIIIASITIANLFAIRQKNLKRFMAFSAISQAGYLVLGVMGGTEEGMTSLVFYLLVYMAANLGAFTVINVIEQKSGKIRIDDYDGLYETNPHLSFIMTLCLFSLAGIPPFAGFFSKFFIFMAAFKAGYQWLVLIALVNTVLSLYYYLLIVKAMYIRKNEHPIASFRSDNYSRAALTICTLGVVLLGLVSMIYDYIATLGYGM